MAIAFTANKPLHLLKTSRTRRLISALKPPKVAYKRLVDAITKIHEIIVYILATSQRSNVFMANNAKVEGEMLCPICENNTRWFLIYLMLICAILLKDLIDLYIL